MKAAAGERADLPPVNELLQDPPVARQFQALGYRYVHIGSWCDPDQPRPSAPTSTSTCPRRSAPPTSWTRSTTRAPCRPCSAPARLDRVGPARRQYDSATYALDAARRACATSPGRSSSSAHVLLPHPPFVFDRDGTFMSDAEARSADAARAVRAPARLHERRGSGRSSTTCWPCPRTERPIIILQADEGP